MCSVTKSVTECKTKVVCFSIWQDRGTMGGAGLEGGKKALQTGQRQPLRNGLPK